MSRTWMDETEDVAWYIIISLAHFLNLRNKIVCKILGHVKPVKFPLDYDLVHGVLLVSDYTRCERCGSRLKFHLKVKCHEVCSSVQSYDNRASASSWNDFIYERNSWSKE